MGLPLNIDWQQILLHLFNFLILAGGLYLLLYKPVKQFMDKREQTYQAMNDAADQKARQAQQAQQQAAQQDTREEQPRQPYVADKLPGRNDPCPCGSGKKFKNCHGRGLV